MRVHFVHPYEDQVREAVSASLEAAGLRIGRVFSRDEPLTAVLAWLEGPARGDGLCIPYNPGPAGTGVDTVEYVLGPFPKARILMPVRFASLENVLQALQNRLDRDGGSRSAGVLALLTEEIPSPASVERIRRHFLA
ncbi:MAG: hypothetical protein L0216_07845 [Planctomycetales bacterium]|nr:hypothetical protein [Planctomycetales bacterium]